MTAGRQLRFVLLGIATIAWLGLGAEALCRFEGNWRFNRFTLIGGPQIQPDPAQGLDAERALVQEITYQKGVNPNWFFLPPAPLKMTRSRELEVRTAANPNAEGQENFVWNEAWLAHPDAAFVDFIRHQNTATLFAFPSYDGSPFPRYRLFPNNDFWPTPWVTNRWGWLGTDAGVRKPPHTIRVGIIGDSTSQNMYALNLQSFLKAWAKHHGYNVGFEVFSTARQGLEHDDELAVLKYELSPMGLDYIYQYFAPAFAIQGNAAQLVAFSKLPANVLPGRVPPEKHPVREAIGRLLAPLTPFSALANRARTLITRRAPDASLPEPAKPNPILHLPPGTENPVVLEKARKDPYFGALIEHLETFKRFADVTHTVPFVSTERVCAWDGMLLRNDPNRYLYEVMNGPLFWPFSYAQIRRVLAAHNGVIKAWARASGVTVVDIDGRMPANPELCGDAYHDVEFGHRMRAWLIFQAMLPQLEHDLRTGVAPRANGLDGDVHPYLSKPIERIDRKAWLAKIDSKAVSSALAR